MSELRNTARGASEWADTYGSMGMAAPARLMQLPLHILDPWMDTTGEAQPFQPYTPAMLEDLAENIRRNGIIQPINVRPRPGGRFQIIAGHNRVAAAKIVGLPTVPALVQELDDDQAAILMIDSNLKTRPHILPSERARAYKLRMEKLHRKKGRPKKMAPLEPFSDTTDIPEENDTTGAIFVEGATKDIISAEFGISSENYRRYLRLNDLHPDMLKMVDNGSLDKERQDKNIPAMALRAGVELSYIPIGQQALLLMVIREYGCKAPSMAQAGQLRSLSAAQPLDVEAICGVMVKANGPKVEVLKLPAGRLRSLFSPGTFPEQMEAEIYEALIAYRKNQSPASV